MPATLFFLTETADWWTFAPSGHLAWLDEGSLFSLNYYFYSWICLHSWNSLDCDLPVPAAVSGPAHAPDPLAVDPGPPVSCTAPTAPGDQHSAQVGLFTNIDHWPWLFRHLARQGLRILPSPMDGHCLLHSVCSSWKSQVSQLKQIDLETIKINIFTETTINADKYFEPFNYNSFALFQGLRLYLIQRLCYRVSDYILFRVIINQCLETWSLIL